MRAQGILAFGLVGFVVLVHSGCGAAECPPGYDGPIDNRDRKAVPYVDHDWICLAPRERLPVPDVGGDKPADEPGPKNMEAVAKAAIFISTCLRETIYNPGNINEQIDRFYRTIASWSSDRAIADRINCFKNKTNGCDAVRECLGILVTADDPRYAEGCYGGIAMKRFDTASMAIRNIWSDCVGLGLECRDGQCAIPTEPCETNDELPFCAADGAPRNCGYDTSQEAYARALVPSCAQYGLECVAGEARAICAGSGPSCTPTESQFDALADYHAGIECADGTTLRACVNQRESLVDCAKLGEGFKCIGGTRPQCGADFQCDYEGWDLSTTCDDNFVEVCNAGVRMKFDCTALGFETCYAPLGACKAKPLD